MGGSMPAAATGVGGDVSPHLAWGDVPPAAVSLALICHDPDAPRPHGWTHWVVAGIDPNRAGLMTGEAGTLETGTNDWGDLGYRGPMPPVGHGVHHYYFWLYALDTDIPPVLRPTRESFLRDYAPHVLAQARTVGLFER